MSDHKKCQHCGEPIIAPRVNQKFCSWPATCRNAAWREAHLKRRAAAKRRAPREPFMMKAIFGGMIF